MIYLQNLAQQALMTLKNYKDRKMKYIKVLLLFIAMLVSSNAFGAHQLYADIDGINIPYGTKLELSMAENISTKGIEQGDMFQAYLTKDIYVNNKLILPSRTLFRGRIAKVEYSKSLSRPAKLTLNLDHLVTKYGTQLPINSGVASNFDYILKNDGSLTTNGNYFKAVARDVKKSAQILPRTVKWGMSAGNDLFTGAKILFVPVAALGGTVACVGSSAYNIVADLFKHGDEIIIKRGTLFNIILLSTLDVPS